ncbi:MAG: right-handed parallel beta-helix repeat-containing protein [Burkholderiaceae bacterium]|nr:MAG: right-handed parallel beta-helix repeat-containing protein [Burkholderiaceae bacterium]
MKKLSQLLLHRIALFAACISLSACGGNDQSTNEQGLRKNSAPPRIAVIASTAGSKKTIPPLYESPTAHFLAQPTIRAKTCGRDDVQEALDRAPDHSIIDIPSGDCDWKDLPVVKRRAGFWIRGATFGTTTIRRTSPVVMIKNEYADNHFLFEFDCSNAQSLEISNLTLIGNDKLQNEEQRFLDLDSGINLKNHCKDFQIHDSRFNDFSHTAIAISDLATNGVIYNNEFKGNFKCQTIPANCMGYGVMILGDSTWPDLTLGENNAVVVEDNLFSDNRHGVTSNEGSQYVVRRNTFESFDRSRNFAMIDAHGRTQKRGSRSWEIYQNKFIDKTTRRYNTASIGLRGGDGVIWGNIYEASFHTAVNFWPEASCKKRDGTFNTYPLSDQTTDAWVWGNIIQTPTLNFANYFGVVAPSECAKYFITGRDLHLEPKPHYRPLAYPHPLRRKT